MAVILKICSAEHAAKAINELKKFNGFKFELETNNKRHNWFGNVFKIAREKQEQQFKPERLIWFKVQSFVQGLLANSEHNKFDDGTGKPMDTVVLIKNISSICYSTIASLAGMPHLRSGELRIELYGVHIPENLYINYDVYDWRPEGDEITLETTVVELFNRLGCFKTEPVLKKLKTLTPLQEDVTIEEEYVEDNSTKEVEEVQETDEDEHNDEEYTEVEIPKKYDHLYNNTSKRGKKFNIPSDPYAKHRKKEKEELEEEKVE